METFYFIVAPSHGRALLDFDPKTLVEYFEKSTFVDYILFSFKIASYFVYLLTFFKVET